MRNYELMFIINPEITEEERESIISHVEKDVNAIEATDLKVEKMGEKKLAYLIDKKSTGFYVLFKFNVDGTKLGELERKLNITEGIMRYILVKQG